MTVAVLFADPKGIYSTLPDVDLWDVERDATRYAGPHPVVAHPPCARWSILAALAEAVHGIPRHDDGGLFASALASVRKWGGVLEHPAQSAAFVKHGITPPKRGCGWQRARIDAEDEWVCDVAQRHYGHAAIKRTWLLAVRVNLPILPGGDGPSPEATVYQATERRQGGEVQNTLSHRARAATPPAFADLLLSMARSAL